MPLFDGFFGVFYPKTPLPRQRTQNWEYPTPTHTPLRLTIDRKIYPPTRSLNPDRKPTQRSLIHSRYLPLIKSCLYTHMSITTHVFVYT